MFKSLGRSVFLSVLILSVGVAGLALQASAALAAPGDISGTVFDDVNEDGANAGEPGLAGVTVTAFDSSGATAGSATSDANGDYTINGLNNAEEYRIEFSGLPAGYTDGPSGADSETSVTFARPEVDGIDYGAVQPQECSALPSNALVNTFHAGASCSVLIDPATPQDGFALFDIDATVPATGRVDQTGSTNTFKHPDWDIDQIGNLFGTAVDNTRGDFYAAASSNYSPVFYNNAPGVPSQARR